MRALALLCLVAALVVGGRAEAHAQLVASAPDDGAVVAVAPAAVTLDFSEPVRPLVVRWFPPGGAVPQPVVPAAEGMRLVVPMPADAAQGTWLLSWRVVSEDGHPVGGSRVLSIGAPSAVAEAPGAGTARAAAAGRGLLTLALVFGVGGVVFLRLVDRGAPPPPGAVRVTRGALWAVPAVAVLATGLHGLDLLGLPGGALFGPAPWAAALRSPFAATVAMAVLAALVALRGRGGWAAGVAWALAALSFALFGHAATAAPRWLTAPCVALHAAAFIFWIGALPGLAGRAAGRDGSLLPTLRRFSALAVPLVALLAASGTVLAVVQVRHPAALVDTAYGRLLLVKLVVVGLLLALAALNRLRLTPAVARGEAAAPDRLRRSVLAEIAVGVVVLALASGFRLTPPPRAMVAMPVGAHVHLHGPALMADVTLLPGGPGPNRVEIVLASPSGEAVDPVEVRVSLSDPARGVEPIRLQALGDGATWDAGPVMLPFGGTWTVRLDALVSDFVTVGLAGEARVGER